MAVIDTLAQLVFKDTIVLDDEAFQKASQDFADLADKLDHLYKDVDEMLAELQKGFDTPAGHKFVSACNKTLLENLDKQKAVISHVSENLNMAKNTYQSVFTEYQELVNLINSN